RGRRPPEADRRDAAPVILPETGVVLHHVPFSTRVDRRFEVPGRRFVDGIAGPVATDTVTVDVAPVEDGSRVSTTANLEARGLLDVAALCSPPHGVPVKRYARQRRCTPHMREVHPQRD